MRILKISKANILEAIKIMKAGGVVVYPTETVYGIGCHPFNQAAVERVYKIKGRGFNKPFILIADSFKTVEKNFKMDKKEKELAKKYWPGALTIILKLSHFRRGRVQKEPVAHFERGGNKVAVRISPNRVAQELAQGIGGLIVSTSANVSNQPPCMSAQEVFKQFKNRRAKPDIILNAGRLPQSKPSTVVEVVNSKIEILRQGKIKL